MSGVLARLGEGRRRLEEHRQRAVGLGMIDLAELCDLADELYVIGMEMAALAEGRRWVCLECGQVVYSRFRPEWAACGGCSWVLRA